MAYVDGFIIAVPKDRLADYEALARVAGEVWKEYGALAYVEALADDVSYGELTSFPRAVMATEDEIVVFSWIVYPSRAARDDILQKVMADPRLRAGMEAPPFDAKRMIWGGFTPFVEF
ncbi:DUF1428 domain-containing protein [Salinarimonas rosea]|uniref:DUF1428 domain-containing protein n=1 Tax=Salinarimonas rosea TaxID=552063 RepID=UPI000413DD5F|nr:DUF1428 family protein [Salinarimonas rosea]